MAEYLRFVWPDAPTDEPYETLLELDAERYDTRRIELFVGGKVFMALESLNADYLAESPWPTDAELSQPQDVAFQVYSLTPEAFATAWAWASEQPQRGRY